MASNCRGKYALSFLVSLILSAGCGKASEDSTLSKNLVVPNGNAVERTLGDGENAFLVIDAQTFQAQLKQKKILSPDSIAGKQALGGMAKGIPGLGLDAGDAGAVRSPLILGFPLGLLGENHVFGGVVTKVSDTANEKLGGLKLTDLSPLHVKPVLGNAGAGQYVFALIGCATACGEGADEEVLLSLPVLGIDQSRNVVLLDIAGLGDSLNLIKILDPKGAYTSLKTKTNLTQAFDYSYSTLVFDVETTMEPVTPTVSAAADTVFTVRWYLRLSSTFDPAFVARSATPGVGFFMTERSATPKIQRFALPKRLAGADKGSVHYYIKGVPSAFQSAFRAAFDEWNGHFYALLGKRLLSYEFVDVTDARFAALVPGDVRYNILEWDTVNAASYGGLGPSIANQYTGETLSANVLIQGPAIVSIYTKWFQVSQTIAQLQTQGETEKADALLRKTLKELDTQVKARELSVVSLSLGKLPFSIRSQQASLEDPLWQRTDFEPIPAGMDYASYMDGYFRDMVAHELGHNLGLRHNFRGNLGAAPTPSVGAVSRSIMEYLGRAYRYLSRIGAYDAMAIAYGYGGMKPAQTNLFCTDEEVPDEDDATLSAECSRDDATPNPFGYFETQLDRSVTRLLARGTADAPTWTVPDMQRELGNALKGLGLYASSAATTAAAWTNFYSDPTRPRNPSQIRGFVLEKVRDQLCGPLVNDALALKTTANALSSTVANLAALRAFAEKRLTEIGAFTSADLQCQP
jgi:hypothetical protein